MLEKTLKNMNMDPSRYVGGGVNGRIFETKNGDLIKIVLGNNPMEYKALKKLSGYGLAPRVIGNGKVINTRDAKSQNLLNKLFNGYTNNKVTVFRMSKVSGVTLKRYIKLHPNFNWKPKYKKLIENIHGAGIVHGNLHHDNILVTSNGKLMAINTGRSLILPAGINANTYFKQGLAGKVEQIHNRQPVYKGRNVGGTISNANKAKIHFGISPNTLTAAKRRSMRYKYKPTNRTFLEKIISKELYNKLKRKIFS